MAGRLRKRIIYVDDVNYSLVSVKNRLSDIYDVYVAESSRRMYDFLSSFLPELILLDINMPGIDGYETIKGLKADERYSHIPVIFLTGNSDKESVVKGLSLGAADYVVKPYSTAKLLETIENQLKPQKPISSLNDENSNKPVILVIDDVASMLRAIQTALSDRYKVYTLLKSEDALDFLKTKIPDLILLDYVMPGINGFDLIPLIKAIPKQCETPIIIISSEGTQGRVNSAISLGASDFIVKPFNSKELNDKVAKHIRIARELKRIRNDAF